MHLIYHYSIQAIWIAWFLYWLLMARNVKRTVRRENVLWRILYVGLLVLGASMFTFDSSQPSILDRPLYAQSRFTFWLGIALMLAGFAFTAWARVTLGRNWSGTVTLKENHELIENGPYAWVRHPIYTGLLIMFVGTAIPIAELRGAVAVLLVLLSFLIKLRIEERWMTELFRAKYDSYCKRVAMLIPWIW